MKKIFIIIISFFSLANIVTAKEKLSIDEQQSIDNFMQFRVNLTLETDDQIVLKRITKYQSNLTLPSTFSAETKLIIENFIILEKYNYMYSLDINNPNLSELILTQKEKNDNWFDTHDSQTINKWLYCTSADVMSCCMQFVSKTKAMKFGMNIKKNYEAALKIDPNMSYALFGMGQWLIQAPRISGGSKKDAIETFKKALTSSRNDAEKFYAYILLSQGYFENDQKQLAAATLKQSNILAPKNNYTTFIKLLNDNDYSLYYYVTHREKIDKKLNIH